jgi:hypothetical protein
MPRELASGLMELLCDEVAWAKPAVSILRRSRASGEAHEAQRDKLP